MTSPYSSSSNTTPGSPGRTVVGLFTDRSDAEDAIRDLKEAGFSDKQVGVALRDRDEQKQLMQDTGSTAAEGAATGALSGGVVGGLIGLLGSLLIPGVGPIVVGGVLASALTGAGIGAATGGLIGGLMGLGVPEEDAQHFNRGIESGSILVTVNAGDRIPEALAILQAHNVDLGPSGVGRFQDTGTAARDLGTARTEVERRPVVREELSFENKERRRGAQAGYAGPERRVALV